MRCEAGSFASPVQPSPARVAGADSTLQSRAPLIRIDHLYTLLAVSATTIAVSLLAVPPNDLWWHMRVGQIIAQARQIPQSTVFAWSIPADTPEVYAVWLGEVLLYAGNEVGGSSFLIFVRNAMAAAVFALVGIEAQRRSGSWKLAGLAVALAGLMGINNVVLRPQIWSWLPFMLFLLILYRYRDRLLSGWWLVALPLLMAFWVNVHGAFVLGIALVGGVAVGETARYLLRQPDALDRGQIASLYATGLGTGLATMANPLGPGIFAYVRALVTDPPSQRLVIEWQPPAPTDLPNGVFFGSILLLLAAFAYARSRPSITDLLLLGGFLWLAWNGMRYVFWFGLVAMPILAQCLARGSASPRDRPHPRQSGLANTLIAAFLVVPVILVQPWFVRGMPLPEAYFERMVPPPAPPLLDTETPVAAAEYLRANPGGRLFNQMGYGSYLIWALPEQPVFLHPRVELYPLKQWEDYVEISQGRRATQLLEQYGANRALLSLKAQPKLSQALGESPAWEREYADQWSEIWRRRS